MTYKLLESEQDFLTTLETNIPGIYEVKLRAILELAESKRVGSSFRAHLPPVGLGSITLVDQIFLVAMLKILSPRNILEIGTFKGFTTRLLLENSSAHAIVTTVDLPKEKILAAGEEARDETRARTDGKYNDQYLRLIHAIEGPTHLLTLGNG